MQTELFGARVGHTRHMIGGNETQKIQELAQGYTPGKRYG